MPWKVEKSDRCPASKPWAVIKEADGSVEGCHETKAKAEAQQAALYASEGRGIMSKFGDFLKRLRGLMDEAEEEERVKGGGTAGWDGSASNFESTDAYCKACLIDVNAAAGRDEKVQSHCMLPVKAPGSTAVDQQGMHAAAVRFTQVKKPDDVSQEDWDSAVKAAANKLITAYNSFDETAPDSVYEAAGKEPPKERAIALQQVVEQFWSLLDKGDHWRAWPMDIYLDGEDLYMLVAEEGKLYRAPVEMEGAEIRVGEWLEVEAIHQPVGRTYVLRQADGSYRWFSIAATAVLNRVGEIDSTALFDSFVRRFKEAKAEDRPRRDFFHLGEAAVFGDVDFLERDGWCLIASGPFHDTPLGQAMRRALSAEPGKWGDSISYLPLAEPTWAEVAEGVRVPVYEDGALRFISSLYEDRAASPFTTAIVQEVMRMRTEILEALQGLKAHGLTEEDIEQIAGKVDSTNREIDEHDLVRRGSEAEPGPVSEPQAGEVILDDEALAAIVARVLESEALIGLTGRAEALERQLAEAQQELADLRALNVRRSADVDKRLAELEKDEGQKRREWQADLPARSRTVVTYRPREAKAKENGDEERDLAAVAAQTLAGFPKA